MALKVNKYKGYIGTYEVNIDGPGFYGKVCSINDLVTFLGNDRDELQKSFEDSVDDYIEFCSEIDKSPQKPYNGVFQVRVTPELHQQSSQVAVERDLSLNQFVAQSLERNIVDKEMEVKYVTVLVEPQKTYNTDFSLSETSTLVFDSSEVIQ